MSLLVLLRAVPWPPLRQLPLGWPIPLLPLLVTGIYAVHRARPAIQSARAAAGAGALAGLAAAALSLLAAVVVGNPALPAPLVRETRWDLVTVLSDSPFLIPRYLLLLDLPFTLPIPWSYTSVAAEGQQFAQLPMAFALYLPVGALLSALQASLFYLLVAEARAGERLTRWIMRSHADFRAKLLAGFALLTAIVVAVGLVGYQALEDMHLKVHPGRVMQHWLDHTLRVQRALHAYADALDRLPQAEDAAQEVSALGRQIAGELAHLNTLPAPPHDPAVIGSPGANLRREAEKRQPAVRRAVTIFADLDRAAGQAAAAQRAGSHAEARAVVASQRPRLAEAETTVAALASDLSDDLHAWMADADDTSHSREIAFMLLAIPLSGMAAFLLGQVFAVVIADPIGHIRRGLAHIAAGDFSSPIAVESRDELGDLAQSINRTSEELSRLYSELRALNEGLEQKVEEQLQVLLDQQLLFERQAVEQEQLREALRRAEAQRLAPMGMPAAADLAGADAVSVRIFLLGTFSLTVSGRTITAQGWRLRKARTLITLLALAPDHRLHREQLIEWLWPDLEPKAAANNLRLTLHVARRTLEPFPATASSYLHMERDQLALTSSEPLWIDVEAFEHAAAAAKAGRDPAAYYTAIELYGGELLPEDRYEDWAAGRREALARLYAELLEGLAALYQEQHDMAAAVEVLQRLVSADPANEDIHVRLMRLYAEAGQRQDALRQYDSLKNILRRDLDIAPGPASEQAYREILAAM